MMLEEKYVFHIPKHKYTDGKVASIEIDDILDNLISEFARNGYENLYIINAKGYYKSRSFDELLITIYLSPKSKENQVLPDEIFEKWFKDHNDLLQQEAIGYEHNDRLFVEKI